MSDTEYRDEELSALEEELRTPYIESPDEIDEGSGQTCFLNPDRLCKSDCTAFNVFAPIKQGPERCTILVYLANGAVQSQELVSIVKKASSIINTKAQDEQRQALASQPVPDPYGGRR